MVKIYSSWIPILHLDIFKKILNLLRSKTSIPDKSKLLAPFTYFELNQLKIVILGEEPYPNSDLFSGLAFSVNKNIPLPQSIKNIFKEINNEYDNEYTFLNGDLTKWASREKILLLNTSLTFSKTENHKKYWRKYTDLIIKEISDNTNNVCFVLMGTHAKSKKHLIDSKKHCILECIHPSPNSASRGFFGSGIFKKIEDCVGSVNWQN
jgi:uracil-DNA glycosylase